MKKLLSVGDEVHFVAYMNKCNRLTPRPGPAMTVCIKNPEVIAGRFLRGGPHVGRIVSFYAGHEVDVITPKGHRFKVDLNQTGVDQWATT